jgi:hypothetical protein
VWVDADDRKGLEQRCRDISRPAPSDERVQLNALGQVELKFPSTVITLGNSDPTTATCCVGLDAVSVTVAGPVPASTGSPGAIHEHPARPSHRG